jgi:hypothetical protein
MTRVCCLHFNLGNQFTKPDPRTDQAALRARILISGGSILCVFHLHDVLSPGSRQQGPERARWLLVVRSTQLGTDSDVGRPAGHRLADKNGTRHFYMYVCMYVCFV